MKILPTKLQESLQSDNPFVIPLMRVYLNPTTLYFAICDEDIYFDGNLYISFPVDIGASKASTDSRIDNITLEISNVTEAFSSAIFNGYNFLGKRIEIIEIVYPESLTDNTQYHYKFVAEIDSPTLDDAKGLFKVTCTAGIPQITPGRTTALPCSSWFADGETCTVAKNILTGTIQSGTTASAIYISQVKPDGYWKNGIIKTNFESRQILTNVGTKVLPNYPFSGVPSGNYTIENGCGKSTDECDRHNNRMQYAGLISIPWEISIKT